MGPFSHIFFWGKKKKKVNNTRICQPASWRPSLLLHFVGDKVTPSLLSFAQMSLLDWHIYHLGPVFFIFSVRPHCFMRTLFDSSPDKGGEKGMVPTIFKLMGGRWSFWVGSCQYTKCYSPPGDKLVTLNLILYEAVCVHAPYVYVPFGFGYMCSICVFTCVYIYICHCSVTRWSPLLKIILIVFWGPVFLF